MEKLVSWRPAHYVKGRNNCYVAFSVVNPETGKLTIKRIKLNYIDSARQRAQYAEELIKRINTNLAAGFNPFMQDSNEKLVLLSEAVTAFLKKIRTDLSNGIIKECTFEDYKTQIERFQKFLGQDLFLFKIHTSQVNTFLDFLYIEKQLTAYTRNHYLQSLRTFFNFCVQKSYMKENPAKDIANERNGRKRRRPIPEELIKKIFNYLNTPENRFYLLACQLLYSCFIRPSEICGLKIENISFKNQTMFIPASISKNKKSQVVTLPANVAAFLLDLKIYQYPGSYYIVGKGLQPSERKTSAGRLRDAWGVIRKKLKFDVAYQFYSLKDSGITRMINLLDVRQVRDQARHSSISITDVYTDRSKDSGNDSIKKLDFSL